MQRRAFIVGILFSLIIVVYTIRLLVLQVVPTSMTWPTANSKYKLNNWKRTAVAQRSKQLQLSDGRGIFLDEHYKPLQSEQYMTVAFFPVRSWELYPKAKLAELAQLLKQDPDKLRDWLTALEYAEYIYDEMSLPIRLSEEQINRLKRLQTEGFELVRYTARYGHQSSFKHLIGFTGEHPEWVEQHYAAEIKQLASWDRNTKIGVSGLEHSLDRLIHGVGPSYISYTLDASSRYMSGIGPRVVEADNPYYPLNVVTTLDLQLQAALEQLLDKQAIAEGAVVLLDAANGDIKAMVSRPALLPGQWNEVDKDSWRNHALTAYEPGSIYKIVTAAAALEYGVVKENETFHCNGEYGKYGLSCWKKGGHGEQTLEQAFANSCNIVFATLAERLTAQQLYDTASALGAIHPVGWHNNEADGPFTAPLRLLEEEERGIAILDLLQHDGGILAQTGIGQRDVRLTPLQAANMMVTIIHGGRQFETRAVSSINYADGLPVMQFPVHEGHEHRFRIHAQTARKLMSYMNGVVEFGTARQIGSGGAWKLAGKSGTAELSGASKGLNNQWFVGYGPADKPKYAAAVLVRKAKQGSSNKATQLFKQVMELAAEHDRNEQSTK
ncbi:penicillin-binding protein [Paenibacillus montaniterrae]|uniref:Penicillin-binding protein n=1 Tax=Paenibacillus montaniterrae TaxID=429341 RepID=A0A919YLX1_9BACL|nr:penicillin-binding transpeptidase domain-containing protein [Paenibacillus montaniterrae]GIP16847.1 penicillin-binding protein [Paenibacillus montaniterrae]